MIFKLSEVLSRLKLGGDQLQLGEREPALLDVFAPLMRLHVGAEATYENAPLERLADDRRTEMLKAVREGELNALEIEIIATTERENPRPLPFRLRNRATLNFTRFALDEFDPFARSFSDRPFLRNHSHLSQDAGGLILESSADKRRTTHLIRQTVRLVKQWALEDAIDGTMRSFSIGWGPSDPGFAGIVRSAVCTVCDGPMFGRDSECPHMPGEVVKLGTSGERFIVELEWRSVVGRETSEVTFPAAAGTGISGGLRMSTDLAQLAEPIPEPRPRRQATEQGASEVLFSKEFLERLGLPADATVEDVEKAMTAQSVALDEARSAIAAGEEDVARALADLETIEEARRTEVRSGALAAGLFTEGSARAKYFDKVAKRDLDEAEQLLETWRGKPLVPVGSRGLQVDEPAPPAQTVGSFSMVSRVSIPAGGDEYEKFMQSAEHWLIQKSGNARNIEDGWKLRAERGLIRGDQPDQIKIDPGPMRGRSLLELARMCLERAGVDTNGMDKRSVFGHALTNRGGYNATGDFPVLLENVLNKTLLAMYAVTPDTWSIFCATGSVGDFRAHNRYRQGTFGALDVVNEGGEFTNKQIPDARKETITAATRGNIIAITRQALINDDMGAFTRLASQLGRAARLSIEVDVYATLALNGGLGPNMNDGNPLFDATHSNLGAGAALSVASIDENRVVMASQTDESGNEILDLRPAILVLAIGLGGQARVINEAEFDVDSLGASPDLQNKFMQPNRVVGLFRDIVDTARLTGTRRYLFADPNVAPTIEVAFLDGQQEPFLELQNSWRVDGSEWKVRLDYGVSAIDFRGAVTDAGV